MNDRDKALDRDLPPLIDKTMFIKEFVESGDEVTVILRPRRFGKSLNLSMLKTFLSFNSDDQQQQQQGKRNMFEMFQIGNQTEFVDAHCGKYPVLFLDLNDCQGSSWQEMYETVWLRIREMFEPFQNDLPPDTAKLFRFGELYAPPPTEQTTAKYAMLYLTETLFKKYRKRCFVLVDEYDAPLNNAFRNGYYQEAVDFFGPFYSQALKGNSALEKACLMGIVEIRFADMTSGLNNMCIYSDENNDKYSPYFKSYTSNDD